MEIKIMINGVDRVLDVDARLSGHFTPGTMEQPPEYPELDIYSIKDEEGNEIELHPIDEVRIANMAQEILENE